MHRRVAALLLCAWVGALACGDDDPTGTDDTTPPRVSSISAVDSTHLQIGFSEPVMRSEAIGRNYSIVETASTQPLDILSASLMTDGRTVILTTQGMSDVAYTLDVTMSDRVGNSATTQAEFTGSTSADVTAPQLVYRVPASNAQDVPTDTPIEFSFSEGIEIGINFNLTAGGAPVSTSFDSDTANFVGGPVVLLDNDRIYTITISNITDAAGNAMPDISWTFRTRAVIVGN